MRTALGLILLVLAGPGFCGRTAENLEMVQRALAARQEKAAMTVGEWQSLDKLGKLSTVSGAFCGQDTAMILIIAETDEQLYLLDGWRMSAKTYASEVSVIISDNKKCPLGIAFIKAEARFAEAADQPERARALARYTSDAVLKVVSDHEVLRVPLKSAEDWEAICKFKTDVCFAAGFLEGVRIERAAGRSGIPQMSFPFRVGQVADEMLRLVDTTKGTTSLAELMLAAALSLVNQASGK